MSYSVRDLMSLTSNSPTIDAIKCKEIEALMKMCDAIYSLNNQSIFLVDYLNQEFLYLSPHPLFLCGYDWEEVKAMGYSFLEKILPPEDLQMFLETYKITYQIAVNMTSEDQKYLCGSYDFHFRHKNGDEILVNSKFAPLLYTDDGLPWIGLAMFSPSPRKEMGYYIIRQKNENRYFHYNASRKKFEPYEPEKLTAQEEKIIRLSAQGYTDKAIAEKLFISVRTVHNHRYNIERKLGVNNIANAIATFSAEIC